MFKWLTSKSLLVNVIVAVVLIVLLAFAFFKSLGALTKHGETISVPYVVRQTFDEAQKNLNPLKLKGVVLDSAYTDTLPPKVIVEQKPLPGSVVKTGRTVYLTLNKVEPPNTTMPELVNFSFRSAILTLENQKLKLKDTIYKPDIAKGAVLQQLYQNKPIAAGTEIPEGSKITLVIGSGLSGMKNDVPDLVGLTFLQAMELLSANNLNLGVVITKGEIQDTSEAFVFRQSPEVLDADDMKNKISDGAAMDLWISDELTDSMEEGDFSEESQVESN